MAQITKDRLPGGSRLWPLIGKGDFVDCYSVQSVLSPRAAVTRGLALPRWAKSLLAARNAMVRPLGLKTGAKDSKDRVGIFPVQAEAANEILLGFDDRHLDFRIAVRCEGGRAYMSTWVHPHNLWGRFYLRLVMPFHILISRGAAARMAG
jgi:hypothetical protein